jgi:hypothetical protein
MKGFGLNFYGYFVFAAIWICFYALWVSYINKKEKANSRCSDTERR